jgi:hypothetical protein
VPDPVQRGLPRPGLLNQTETLPTTSAPNHARRRGTTQRRRPREEWIEIPCPRILDDAAFEAAQRVSRDNSKWSPRNLQEQAWLLRGLVRCGSCDICLNSHKLGRHHQQDPPVLHLPQQGAQRSLAGRLR